MYGVIPEWQFRQYDLSFMSWDLLNVVCLYIPAIAYISSETWEVVRVRVDTLIESRIEKYAFDVLKVCIRYVFIHPFCVLPFSQLNKEN